MGKRLAAIGVLTSMGLLLPGSSRAQVPSALEALQTASGGAAFAVSMPKPVAAATASAPYDDSAVSSVRRTMTSGMAPERRQVMRDQVSVVTVPRGLLLPEVVAFTLHFRLPPAQAQAEIANFMDGYAERKREAGSRTSAEPRGYTGTFQVDGDIEIYCFVGEENLSAAGEWDENGSRARRVLVHELGHAVYRSLSAVEKAELKSIVIEYKGLNPDPEHPYQDGDENEMFAEAGEIWFGVHQSALYTKGLDTSEPFVKLAAMMRFIERVYGPARSLR